MLSHSEESQQGILLLMNERVDIHIHVAPRWCAPTMLPLLVVICMIRAVAAAFQVRCLSIIPKIEQTKAGCPLKWCFQPAV
jgi:hypothetical protein